MNDLKTRLIGASDLLNNFAVPCDMYDIGLLLLHACRHHDVEFIKRLWKSLFCDEVFPCSTRSGEAFRLLRSFSEDSLIDDSVRVSLLDGSSASSGELFESGGWMSRIERRVRELGEEMYRSDASYVFQLDFIMGCMEGE